MILDLGLALEAPDTDLERFKVEFGTVDVVALAL